jgi:NitT/TauT family transport system substrate-binding protein
MRQIHKLLYGLAAAVPVVALAACSGGGGGGVPTGPAPEVSSITIDVVPTADAAGLYIAQDDGLFAQQGLNVKILPTHGGELAMPDLQSGKVQLVEGNYVSFILAQIAGSFGIPPLHDPVRPINMRIIADGSEMQPGNQGLYVMPSSKYKTVDALANAKVPVGVNSKNNIGAVFLGALLTSNGYKPSQLPEQEEILPLMPQLLAQGKVRAAWLPEPFATEAQQQYGAIKLADFDQGSLQNFPIGCVIGDAKWVQQHPNTVAAFLRAFKQGQRIADTNRGAVEQALIRNGAAPNAQVAATMTLDTYPLVMDVPVMQRVADSMLQFGVITKRFDITSMIQAQPDEITH